MTMSIKTRILAGLSIGCLVMISHAPALSATSDFSKDDRQRVLEETARHIENSYLDPAKGREIADGLRSKRKLAKDKVARPIFAERVNDALYLLSGDRHLKLKWEPPGLNGGTLPTTDHGITELKILSGNIGLLRLDGFFESVDARRHMLAALSLLENTDALIFDLRENRGGASDAVRFLQGCFFRSPELVMIYEDEPGKREESYSTQWTEDALCADKPLYVLVGPKTASAAEDFALSVQHFKLGQLVGGRTAGAAHFVNHITVQSDFRLAISVGQPLHPATNTNWEGTGLSPDTEVLSQAAPRVAHELALRALIDETGRDDLLYRLYELRSPTEISPTKLKPLTGRYGAMRIDLLASGLELRGSGYRSRLEPIGPHSFRMEGDGAPMVLFQIKGSKDKAQQASFVLLHENGTRRVFERR